MIVKAGASSAINNGDSVAFRSEKGQYLTAVDTAITASSPTIGPDQTFTLSDVN